MTHLYQHILCLVPLRHHIKQQAVRPHRSGRSVNDTDSWVFLRGRSTETMGIYSYCLQSSQFLSYQKALKYLVMPYLWQISVGLTEPSGLEKTSAVIKSNSNQSPLYPLWKSFSSDFCLTVELTDSLLNVRTSFFQDSASATGITVVLTLTVLAETLTTQSLQLLHLSMGLHSPLSEAVQNSGGSSVAF